MPNTLSRPLGLALLAGALLVTSGAAPAREKLRGEALIDKLVAGRVAGTPVDCIRTYGLRSTTVVDGTAILYDSGSVIYVNRPRGGADMLDDDDIMVTRQHDTSLCSIDIVALHDRTTFMEHGFVSLGEFVPYRRIAARN